MLTEECPRRRVMEEPTGLYNYLPRTTPLRNRISTGKGRTRRIGALKKGLLTKLGYSVNKNASTRHRAVDRAVKKYGKLSTLRKLNAVRVYTRRSSPTKSRAFKSDVRYVQKKYY